MNAKEMYLSFISYNILYWLWTHDLKIWATLHNILG